MDMSNPFLGAIFLVGFNFAPLGYAFCAGQLMSIAQYNALFALIGTTYGGDGINTFALPDLRGRVAVGMGTGPGLTSVQLGESSGREYITLQTSNLPSHTHTAVVAAPIGRATTKLNAVTEVGNSVVATGNYLAANKAQTNANFKSTGSVVALNAGSITNFSTPLPSVSNSAVGNGIPFNIRMPYLGLNYIIALEGIFPTQ